MRRQVSVTTRCEDGTTINDKMLLNQAFNMQLKEQQKEIEKQKEMLLNDQKKIEKQRSDFAQEKDMFSHFYTKLQKKEYILENAANSKEFFQKSPSKVKRTTLPSMSKDSKKKVEVVDDSDEETIASEHTHFNDKTLIGDDPCIVDKSVSKNNQTKKTNGKYIYAKE